MYTLLEGTMHVQLDRLHAAREDDDNDNYHASSLKLSLRTYQRA